MNWLPLRHRYDKTSANRFDTAENIWKTIQNPVTEELMQGKGLDTVQDKIQEDFGTPNVAISGGDISWY